MLLPCPSCKAELSAALVGADGRCPYCGTKAELTDPVPLPRGKPIPAPAPLDTDDTEPAPRARVSPPLEEREGERGGGGHGAIGEHAERERRSAAGESRAVGGLRDAPSSAAETVPKPKAAAAPLPRGWGGLAVGARGILHGKATRITGRVRFNVERPRMAAWWDVWLVEFGEGGDGWLCDREGALTILRPFTPTGAVQFDDLREGKLVRLDAGSPATVVDLGTAVVRGSEGETEWETGGTVRFAVLAGDGWRYHLQWWKELEAFRGEPVEPSMLAAGFALRAPSGFRDSAAATFDTFNHLPTSLQILLITLAIPVGVWIGITLIANGVLWFWK